MKSKDVNIDLRKRISLQRSQKEEASVIRISTVGTNFILEPVRAIPKREAWLFEPENKEVLAQIRESLSQEVTINLGSFKKYLSGK